MNLNDKNIILGITGSISAYKSPMLIRELVKAGANVNVVMTSSARQFVTEEVLSNLSKNHVICELFDHTLQDDGAWHIHLAHKADLMIIAPCSAATMGKLANGICDNSLTVVSMALPKSCPLLIAPAMDTTMYENPATQNNIKRLKDFNYKIIPPESGELSSGIVGMGRLPEISFLFDEIVSSLDLKNDNSSNFKSDDSLNEAVRKHKESEEQIKFDTELELQILKNEHLVRTKVEGKNILITAGPTVEKIDDVRYISNHSTGKMGYALATACRDMGANVILVSGPTNIDVPENISVVDVNSAEEMYREVIKLKQEQDIFIMTAAVSDYTPEKVFDGKIKKGTEKLNINLVKTKDILKEVGVGKNEGQYIIGFALESNNEIEYGRKKLVDKKCDMVVVNSANKSDSGFGGDKNKITILKKGGQSTSYPVMSKLECAFKILENID